MPGPTLYSWGPMQFEVYPMNVGEVDHTTATEWARKEVAGAAIYREWVGELDEEIRLRGKVFPHFFAKHMRPTDASGNPARGGSTGGLSHLDIMDNMRRLGQAHTLVRGGMRSQGWHLGWFVMERLSRGHSFLAPDGVGQQIQFEATFQRVPVPQDPADYYVSLWSGAMV